MLWVGWRQQRTEALIVAAAGALNGSTSLAVVLVLVALMLVLASFRISPRS